MRAQRRMKLPRRRVEVDPGKSWKRKKKIKRSKKRRRRALRPSLLRRRNRNREQGKGFQIWGKIGENG
jgi:hypothetical protein